MKALLMKTKKAAILFSAVVLVACQKEAVQPDKPVEVVVKTEYDLLTPYDSTTGRPLNMLKDNISAGMLKYIKDMLPEKQDIRKTYPDLLNTNTAADIRITERSDVYITFVSTVTAFRNAIAFYTYPTGMPPKTAAGIKKITYLFPSAGVGTKLKAGDKLKLGTFRPGTSIGLVLMKSAFEPGTGALNNGAVQYFYNDALNPEADPKLKKHVVLLNYSPENKELIGFENTNRATSECDHDFNDAVLYVTISR